MKDKKLATATSKERILKYVCEFYYNDNLEILENGDINRPSDNKLLTGKVKPYRGGYMFFIPANQI